MKYELVIDTDSDLQIRYGENPYSGRILALFHGDAATISESLKDFLSQLNFNYGTGQAAYVAEFQGYIDELSVEAVSENFLQQLDSDFYFDSGGNRTITFRPATGERYVF